MLSTCTYLAAGFLLLVVFSLYVLDRLLEKRIQLKDLKNRHVVITGGSSGIGLATGKEAAKLGAHVSVIGRNCDKLNRAIEEIKKCARCTSQKIQAASLDITLPYNKVSEVLSSLESTAGPIFMLINSAGSAICGRFEDMSEEDIRSLISLNYFGTAFPTKYVLPGMKSRGEGRIVFVSSEAALLGIYGLSAYSGAKWAVRGLAESVAMELVGTGVHLTLSFPPDTDTPGYHAENEGKPEETKLICDTSGLMPPDDVAKQLIKDAMAGKPYSVSSFGGTLMTLLYCPSIDSTWQVLVQVLFAGILRLVFVGFILNFHTIIKGELKKKKANESKTK